MADHFKVSPQVDRALAIEHYHRLAEGYDASCKLIEPIRRKAIAILDLKPGEAVLDIASGTGKSIEHMAWAVGEEGNVIAIEQSPVMAAISVARTTRLGLTNVHHIVASAEDAVIGRRADAALFHYTHDVFRTPAALENVFASLRPGARIVIAGYKAAKGWRAIFNPWFQRRACGYLSTFEGLGAPWSHLIKHVPDFHIVNEYFLGSGYIALGSVPELSAARSAGNLGGAQNDR